MNRNGPNWMYLLLLILSGEAVFVLPFVLQRIFRPTVLDVFRLDNTQLGICFSLYGVVALVSYLLGGPIADRFPPRKLIAVALWMTALGGLFYASFPSFFWLKVLYGYWGFTTIFLFWSPMIKATRVWGGDQSQGKAFGLLDGGRGLTGVLFGVMGVFIFSLLLPEDIEAAPFLERKEAFTQVIYYSSFLIAIIGLLVWLYLKSERADEEHLSRITFRQIGTVLKLPSVWLLMLIVMFAYVGYKITDDISLYAREVMGYDEVVSARTGTFLLFIRAMVGVLAGIIADRTKTTVWLFLGFGIAFLGAVLFALGIASAFGLLFAISVLIVAAGVYAARALYFAVFREGRIPVVLTGTATGLVSVIGFTPDIFAGVLMGHLLDSTPGETGHRQVFWMLACFALAGMITTAIYHWYYGRKVRSEL